MEDKIILYVLTEYWCGWEGAYAVDRINAFSDNYIVETISEDGEPQVGMSGITSLADRSAVDFGDWDELAMVIMPGGLTWESREYPAIRKLVEGAVERHIPVCAICGATTFLCRNGFLNNVRHTGDSREWFLQQTQFGYAGEDLYEDKQVVYDGGILTANETAAVEFAYEIMNILDMDTQEDRDEWYEEFRLCRGTLKEADRSR